MASPPDGSSPSSPPLPSVADKQAATASSIISTNNEVVDDPSMRALQVAMTAADAIRKSLQQMDDPEEELLWVPPGTLPGVVAFGVAGLLLSPLRSAVLSRAAATHAASTSATIKGAAGRRQHAAAAAMAKNSDSTTSSTKTAGNNDGMGSFANLLDLIVTPAMAVIAAQVGLVVGTLCGSTYYLQRVIVEDGAAGANKGVNGFRTEDKKWNDDESSSSSSSFGKTDQEEPNNTNAILCKSLLNVAIPSNNVGDNQSSSTLNSDELVGLDARRDELIFDSGRSSSVVPPPLLYPAWDPRQTTILSLYKAIQHCQQQQQQHPK